VAQYDVFVILQVDGKLKRIKNTIAELKERIRDGGGEGKRKGDSASPNREAQATRTVS
jgi:ribosomal protein S6